MICRVSPLPKELNRAVKKRTRRQPGREIAAAAQSIPRSPAVMRPIPAAISTGRAPGVIEATTTASSKSSFDTRPYSSTAFLYNTGISAFPPPKPRRPHWTIAVISLKILCFCFGFSFVISRPAFRSLTASKSFYFSDFIPIIIVQKSAGSRQHF